MENFEPNWLAVIVAALVPTIVGFLWYGPLFGKQWLDSMGWTKEDEAKGNMPVIFGISFVMAIILSMGLLFTITGAHQPDGSFATFKHGALHGVMLSFFLSVPTLVSGALFQRSTGKNIILNVAYWMITMAIMGGILDMWR